MCTAVLSIQAGRPVLLAGVRDELTSRAWEPPGRHWPCRPGLVGGRDLQAGGTWLAVDPDARRVACVLNGIGQAAPPEMRRSRGELPLRAAADEPLDQDGLPGFDPFRLLVAERAGASLISWNGRHTDERTLGPGVHMIVNSALMSVPPPRGRAVHEQAAAPRPPVAPGAVGHVCSTGQDDPPPDGREHERARLARFLNVFAAADPPDPRPGTPVGDAWGAWFPLVNGDGLSPRDPAALIVRRDLGDGRVWGTTSVSLVALGPDRLRYDFCGRPGDPGAWTSVL